MADVARASVNIVPDTKGFGVRLREQLARIDTGGAGRSAGSRFGRGMEAGIARSVGRVGAIAGATGAAAGPLAATLDAAAGAATGLGVALGSAVAGGAGAAAAGMTTLAQVVGTVKLGTMGMKDAIKANAAVMDALAAGVEPTKAQLKKVTVSRARLAPAARDVVTEVGHLRQQFVTLGPTVQQALFAGMADELKKLGTSVLPVVNANLAVTATQLNHVGKSVLAYISSGAGMSQVNSIFTTNHVVIDRLGAAITPLTALMLKLLNAAGPLLLVMTNMVGEFAATANAALDGAIASGKMSTAISIMSTTMQTLWDMAKNLAGALANVFLAAGAPANDLLGELDRLTQKFQDWTGTVTGQNAIADFVKRGLDFLLQLESVLKMVTDIWTGLSSGSSSSQFTDAIMALLPPLGELLKQLSNPDTVKQFAV